MRCLSVAFIQTPCYELEDDRLEPSLGLLYLATWLQQHGYSAQIIDLSSLPPQQWPDYLPHADIYGFSTYTTTYFRTLQIAQLVKGINPAAWTVAGGPHASALPETVAQDFDFVVVGEGETAMLRLVEGLARGDPVPSIWREQPLADLDILPFPDYSLVSVNSYRRIVAGASSLSVLSSRGCPHQCVFCNSIIMGGRQKVRFRSAVNVVSEIRQLKELWGITSFRFQDDIFTLNRPRLQELTALLRNEGIIYRCFGRVDQASREVTDLLYEGGCRHIAFGVESGSQPILDRMKKGQSVADIRRGIANAKAAGLMVRVYLIVGFPGETWATIQETVDLMLDCVPHEYSVYPLIPYPGTPIFQNPEAFGITFVDPDFSRYFQVRRQRGAGFVYQTADLDEEKVAAMRAYVMEQLGPTITWTGESKGYK